MIKDRKCPKCNGDMELVSVIERGIKIDKHWVCRHKFTCKLQLTEKGVME